MTTTSPSPPSAAAGAASSTSPSFLQSAFIREDWIQKQLSLRAADFTESVPLTIHIATWNVNAKRPEEDIGPWLLSAEQEAAYSQYDVETLDIDSRGLLEPDLYVIGFQEIVDLNAGNLLVDHNATRPWEDRIERLLRQRYVQVANKSLVGLALLLYVRRPLHDCVSDVVVERVGVGIMGVGGNKGAVAVHLSLYDSRFCFVNSHLSAHQGNSAGRNSDFAAIVQKCRFVDRRRAANAPPLQSDIYDHDFVFWLGDLNYRIDGLDLATLHALIEERRWPELLKGDQLLLNKAAGNAFPRFQEAEIAFAPTYKYQAGTDRYEKREDKKKRLPAWCDRIQWIGEGVQCLQYSRAELCTSDHKPVFGLYSLQAAVLVPDKREAVKAQLLQELDAQENEAMPRISIAPSVVHLERVTFDSAITRTLTVSNIGPSVAQWAFKQRSDAKDVHKRWLSVSPPYGLIPVGDSLSVTLTVHVTRESSARLMTGEDVLEDILILGLENGRDFFITVTGEYRRSAFGCSLEFLVNQPTPVRFSSPSAAAAAGAVLSLPKEIWRLVDWLYTRAMDTPGLFLTNGVQAEVEAVIDCIDTGAELSAAYNAHSVAECLLYFLKQLAEPLFPLSLAEQYDGRNLIDFCRQYALSRLSPSHYNAFVYLVSFLRELLLHRERNRLTAVQLVLVFSAALFHYEVDENDTSVGLAPGKTKPKSWIVLRHYLIAPEFP